MVAVGAGDKPVAKASKKQVCKNGKSEDSEARTIAKPKKACEGMRRCKAG